MKTFPDYPPLRDFPRRSFAELLFIRQIKLARDELAMGEIKDATRRLDIAIAALGGNAPEPVPGR